MYLRIKKLFEKVQASSVDSTYRTDEDIVFSFGKYTINLSVFKRTKWWLFPVYSIACFEGEVPLFIFNYYPFHVSKDIDVPGSKDIIDALCVHFGM